ncbi:MAG: chromate resistance protein ChrB domain-containing protein [Pseudomonadota bacterium]
MSTLVLSLPTRNSTIRMRVWRALKETGCGALRDGVYVLPAAAAGTAVLAAMESEIRAAGGFAMTVDLNLKSAEQLAHVRKLFDRSVDYGALVRKISALKTSLPRIGLRKAQTAVRRLERSFARLSAIDYFPAQARLQAVDAISAIKRDFQETYSRGEPRPSKKRLRQVNGTRYRRQVWATRKDPWVDRLASAWLIKRFIDRDASFVWIDRPRDRPKKTIGFDFDGAEFTHLNNRVTFEVLLASFGLENDPALAAIGAAVHFLDVGGIPVADAKGLETVLRGVKEKTRNDDALLAEAMRILDLFYSAYAQPAT